MDELLEPTAIYAPLVLELARQQMVHAAAHVTGGGIPENLPRVLPEGLGAELDEREWPVLPIFDLVRRAAGATDEDMRATFNMGIGMLLVVAPPDAVRVLDAARGKAMPAYEIGRVVPGEGVRYIS